MPSINIVANLNGGGLERDALIVADLLHRSGYRVWVNNRRYSARRSRFGATIRRIGQFGKKVVKHHLFRSSIHDASLFLQTIEEVWLPIARKNFWIPNPDFARVQDLALVERIDGILCKTRHALAILENVGPPCTYVGFTSVDRRRVPTHEQPDHRRCLHLASGWLKGTEAILSAWHRHPEWPELTVVRRSGEVPPAAAPNIRYLERMPDPDLQILQNEHRIHVCPSETEGFGHCLVEAMSCGAVVVTTNGPPMNELVKPHRGVLVPYNRTGRHCMATTYLVDEAALEHELDCVLRAPSEELGALGGRARAWYERNDRTFRERFVRVLRGSL